MVAAVGLLLLAKLGIIIYAIGVPLTGYRTLPDF
jgi:hypothetical protein